MPWAGRRAFGRDFALTACGAAAAASVACNCLSAAARCAPPASAGTPFRFARRFLVCLFGLAISGGTPRTGARPQVPQNGPRHLHRGARTPRLHSSAQIRLTTAEQQTAPQLFCTDTALRPRLRGRALDHRFRRTGLDTSTEGRAHHGSTALHRYGAATTTPRRCARPQVPQNGPRHLHRGARRPPLHSSSAQIRRCDLDSAEGR